MPRAKIITEGERKRRQEVIARDLYGPHRIIQLEESKRLLEILKLSPNKTYLETAAVIPNAAVRTVPPATVRTYTVQLSAWLGYVISQFKRNRYFRPSSSAPVMGCVQPTQGEWTATIRSKQKGQTKLQDLPQALWVDRSLSKATRPMMSGPRAAAEWAAVSILSFAEKEAPDAGKRRHRKFVFEALRALGIPCPNRGSKPSRWALFMRRAEKHRGNPRRGKCRQVVLRAEKEDWAV